MLVITPSISGVVCGGGGGLRVWCLCVFYSAFDIFIFIFAQWHSINAVRRSSQVIMLDMTFHVTRLLKRSAGLVAGGGAAFFLA